MFDIKKCIGIFKSVVMILPSYMSLNPLELYTEIFIDKRISRIEIVQGKRKWMELKV